MSLVVDIGRSVCCTLPNAELREWLVTNGIGGYASGTISGIPTRRYHALLVAATRPPAGRYVLVSKFDETVAYDGGIYELGATRWRDGTVAPTGFRFIQRFRLDGTIPVWTFSVGDALIEKRIWMEHGKNTTFVTYTLIRGSLLPEIRIKAFAEARPQDQLNHARPVRTVVERVADGVHCKPPDAPSFSIYSNASIIRDTHEWYVGVEYARERERGLDDAGDQLHVANVTAQLSPGHPLTLTLTSETDVDSDAAASLARRQVADDDLARRWAGVTPHAAEAPPWLRQLVLSTDQFIVQRSLADGSTVPTIIAGYPWFADWGRDTMLSLPGLLLRTGRVDVARAVLRAWAGFLDGGMLPNLFSESGGDAAYTSVDASLLFVAALHRTVKESADAAFAGQMFAAVSSIVAAYRDGARAGIRMDPEDALVCAGDTTTSLTWMDARVGDVPVTPRAGKPVEVNALWYNAVRVAAEFAAFADADPAPYTELGDRIRTGFARFWNESEGYLFDVLDGPAGNDASLRPNQLFAVSLAHRALPPQRERAVVDACLRTLLTSYGCRTLSPDAQGYTGTYGGAPQTRDAAYHQGTVWPWLTGPFTEAALNAGMDVATVATVLGPFERALAAYGVGTLFEVASGDAPHTPNGCIAQAWSVAAVIDAWGRLAEAATSGGGSRVLPNLG